MSSTVTVHPAKGVRGIGMFSVIVGFLLIIAGVVVWIVVSMTLSSEEITVSDDANMFAGQHVAGPFTAYAQAEVIDKHATEMAEGKTYAELDQDDPIRESVMDASFLRASLFTSVVAFGVCALVIGLGLMFILIGAALRRLAGGPQVAIETPGLASDGGLSSAPRHADPAPAPVAAVPAADPPARSAEPSAPQRTSAIHPEPVEEPAAPAVPEATVPETTVPEATVPETAAPDVAAPAAPAPETTDGAVPETDEPTDPRDTPRA